MTTEGGNWKDLFRAAKENNVTVVRYHLSRGVDPNFQHPEYLTSPLLEAIRRGHVDVIRVLLEEGKASATLEEDLSDVSPMALAHQQDPNKEEIVNLLLQHMSEEEKEQHKTMTYDPSTTAGFDFPVDLNLCKIL